LVANEAKKRLGQPLNISELYEEAGDFVLY